MKKCFILLIMITLYSCSKYKGDKYELNYDRVTIEFDGYSERYETKENIIIPVTNLKNIEKLNKLKNLSERKWFGNLKGTDYVIRLIYTDSQTGNQLLVRILKSTDSTPSIEYGSGTIFNGTYKNDELVNFVSNIINLEKIEQYPGILDQSVYDNIIAKKD